MGPGLCHTMKTSPHTSTQTGVRSRWSGQRQKYWKRNNKEMKRKIKTAGNNWREAATEKEEMGEERQNLPQAILPVHSHIHFIHPALRNSTRWNQQTDSCRRKDRGSRMDGSRSNEFQPRIYQFHHAQLNYWIWNPLSLHHYDSLLNNLFKGNPCKTSS